MNNRFEVSTEGMRQLHEGRPLWQMVKELVANAWDEDITTCDATIEYVLEDNNVRITVTDDGKGFTDIADAYTLMAPTPKRGIPGVRGRFNIGEKELISIADTATIETVGQTVHFPLEGGKVITKNKRTSGTTVTVTLSGKQDEVEQTCEALRSFIPPQGIKYTVSDGNKRYEVPNRDPIITTHGALVTILAGGKNHPLTLTRRKTQIDIYPPAEERGRIFEMGIPIQSIDAPYDVDICQKVPLPPNRDVVPTGYLQDVYCYVLAVTIDRLHEGNASESWVQIALEDKRTSDETVMEVMGKKLGANPILWTSNLQANENADNAGKDIIKSNMLSKIELERFKKVGLETTTIYKTPTEEGEGEDVEPTPAMRQVEQYAKWLARQLIDRDISVRFMKNSAQVLACYGGGSLTFNIHHLKAGFFNNAPTIAQTSLILHELAHENHGSRAHGDEFLRTLEHISAKAVFLAQTQPWWSRSKSKKEVADA